MAVYTVTLRINVPTLGERIVAFPTITASDIPDAIRVAQAMVIVEPTIVTKTG